MEKNKVIAVLVIVLVLIFVGSYFLTSKFKTSQEFIVTEIIDGDTFVIETGDYVRLIGVDAPEKTDYFYNESKDFLSSLILNKTIVLERDIDYKDKYNRILAYAYTENLSINLELISKGYAVPLFISPNFKHKEEIEQAREECLNKKSNLCASS